MARTTARRTAETHHEVKAREIEKRVRDYHELGRRANSLADNLSRQRLADANGVASSTFCKIRAFAREYTDRELKSLCALRRPDGLPLNWGYVPYLLTVRAKNARREMERLAAEHGWSSKELHREIKKRFETGRERSGGRPLRVAPDPAEALEQIVKEAQVLQRRCESVQDMLQNIWSIARSGERRQQAKDQATTLRRVARALHQLAAVVDERVGKG